MLNSSLLGRPPVLDVADEDELLSDPESSLFDYQVMEEPGYSSVEMLAVTQKRQSMSNREPAQSSSRRDSAQVASHVEDDRQLAHIDQVLDSTAIHANPESLYAMPIRTGQKGILTGSLQTTEYVRNAMQQVHDLSSGDETSRLSNRNHHQSQSHQPLSARSLHFPVEHETIANEKISQSPASTPVHTPKIHLSMNGKNMHQEIIREPVEEPVISPVSAKSTSQSARSVSMADDRIRSLEEDNKHLVTLTSQLENEVQSYQEVVATYNSGNVDTAQAMLTKKQIEDFRKDNESLKNTVSRLNVELSAYQAKYGSANIHGKGEVMGIPSRGPPPSWLFNIRYLNPLFLEYDNRLQQREDVIKKCQADLESLRQRAKTVVLENEKLHSQLEHGGGTGTIDNMEWEQMKENARLVLEENQNLLEQINVKDQKAHDLHMAHVKEVSRITKQLVLFKGETADVEQELDELRKSHQELKRKYDKMVLDAQGQITQEQHSRELSELKQKLLDIETSHKQEVESVNNKLLASQLERKTLGSQVVEVTAENRRLQMEIKLMHKSFRKAQQKMMLLQRAIEQSENKEMSVQEYMSSLIKVAEKNAFERDTYEKVAKEHEVETKKALKRLLQGNLTVGKMEEKLKLYKMKAAARISTVAEKLKEQDELFNSQKKEYEREINHLRLLAKEKDGLLQEVIDEKRDIEEQMEAVWQSANSENVRIKDEIQKSVQQLRKHAGLSEALDVHDKLEAVYASEHENIDIS